MTHRDQTARNRVNAQKSTGPRSERGKAVVAQNARRHGVTGRLDPTSVASWLAVILNQPDLQAQDLMPDDDLGVQALILAQAEAGLVRAEQALKDFESGRERPSDVLTEFKELRDMILDELAVEPCTKRQRREALSLLTRIAKVEVEETARGGKRHRLLQRYVREARAQRRKALQSWVAVRDQARMAA
ncbi:hypothetical protein [Marivita geojedonensis]|uniref:Uncharacterized protein n=1 Tax=Marivita geojedonensis TaxID=1123756 RepID=A0A1X4NRE6_9RHOB|nr:hypothetical protein [Marivita geojedonensis]OSQ53500.1 hypothetical protein MGEO_02945 [Marivita geojedonensis]PRY81496.1 hypothetical protein CLV76_10135 [Marivita geojedonensis]